VNFTYKKDQVPFDQASKTKPLKVLLGSVFENGDVLYHGLKNESTKGAPNRYIETIYRYVRDNVRGSSQNEVDLLRNSNITKAEVLTLLGEYSIEGLLDIDNFGIKGVEWFYRYYAEQVAFEDVSKSVYEPESINIPMTKEEYTSQVNPVSIFKLDGNTYVKIGILVFPFSDMSMIEPDITEEEELIFKITFKLRVAIEYDGKVYNPGDLFKYTTSPGEIPIEELKKLIGIFGSF
jgi:hypothetical protein